MNQSIDNIPRAGYQGRRAASKVTRPREDHRHEQEIHEGTGHGDAGVERVAGVVRRAQVFDWYVKRVQKG